MKCLFGSSFWRETLHCRKSEKQTEVNKKKQNKKHTHTKKHFAGLHAHTRTSDLHSNQKFTKIDHQAFYTLHVELSSESPPPTSSLLFNKIIVFIHILTNEQMLLSHYAKLTAAFLYLKPNLWKKKKQRVVRDVIPSLTHTHTHCVRTYRWLSAFFGVRGHWSYRGSRSLTHTCTVLQGQRRLTKKLTKRKRSFCFWENFKINS